MKRIICVEVDESEMGEEEREYYAWVKDYKDDDEGGACDWN